MKLFVVLVAIVGFAAADVSHLAKKYLPPAQDIPQPEYVPPAPPAPKYLPPAPPSPQYIPPAAPQPSYIPPAPPVPQIIPEVPAPSYIPPAPVHHHAPAPVAVSKPAPSYIPPAPVHHAPVSKPAPSYIPPAPVVHSSPPESQYIPPYQEQAPEAVHEEGYRYKAVRKLKYRNRA